MIDPRRAANRIARDCLGVRCRVLARLISNVYERHMTNAGVRIGQMNLLVAVANHESASPGDLARGLMLDKSTMTRDLQYLESRGYVTIGPGDDGRSRIVRMTDEGLNVISAAYPAWQQAQKAAETELGPVLAAAVAEAIDKRWKSPT